MAGLWIDEEEEEEEPGGRSHAGSRARRCHQVVGVHLARCG